MRALPRIAARRTLRGPVLYSLDFNPAGSIIWGSLQARVRATATISVLAFQVAIAQAAAGLPLGMLQRADDGWSTCVDPCAESGGMHFNHRQERAASCPPLRPGEDAVGGARPWTSTRARWPLARTDAMKLNTLRNSVTHLSHIQVCVEIVTSFCR